MQDKQFDRQSRLLMKLNCIITISNVWTEYRNKSNLKDMHVFETLTAPPPVKNNSLLTFRNEWQTEKHTMKQLNQWGEGASLTVQKRANINV